MRWNGHDFHEAGSCPGRSGGRPTTIHQHADASLLAAHISWKSSLENKDVMKPRLEVSGVSQAYPASHSDLKASHKLIWRLTRVSGRLTGFSGVSLASPSVSQTSLASHSRLQASHGRYSGISLASPRVSGVSLASPGVSQAYVASHSRLQASHGRFWHLTRVSRRLTSFFGVSLASQGVSQASLASHSRFQASHGRF